MAQFYSNPNPHSKTLFKRYLLYLVVLLGVITVGVLIYQTISANNMLIGLFGVFLVGIFIFFAESIFGKDSRNDQGSVGEWEVKEILLSLPDTYSVFQNVPVRKHLDVDFVVVGPTGVFAIEVKSHRRVSSWQWSRFVGQSISETMALKKLLKQFNASAYITSVLVYTRAHLAHQYTSKNVHIMTKQNLLNFVAYGQKTAVNTEQIGKMIQSLYSLRF